MRKPRDFDAELSALTAKARELRTRKVTQLGELVIASGADALTIDQLAGALLAAAATRNASDLEAWSVAGAGFFRGQPRIARKPTATGNGGAPANGSAAQPSGSSTGAS